MADDRLPWRRSPSIEATSSESVRLRDVAISFSPVQNASSRLTLVLCPVMTIERLTTGDFIRRLPNRSCVRPDADATCPRSSIPNPLPLWCRVNYPVGRSALRVFPLLGLLAEFPQIDDLAHLVSPTWSNVAVP